MDKIEGIPRRADGRDRGDRIVELAACWAIVLIITGLFLWFPKIKTKAKKEASRDPVPEARQQADSPQGPARRSRLLDRGRHAVSHYDRLALVRPVGQQFSNHGN